MYHHFPYESFVKQDSHCEIIHNAAAVSPQVLAQRQQEVSTQSVHAVSEVLRGELSAFKDTQNVQVGVLRYIILKNI